MRLPFQHRLAPHLRRFPERALPQLLLCALLLAGTAACSSKTAAPVLTADDIAAIRQYPLQATSLQSLPVTLAAAALAPPTAPPVTQAWIEEKLRALDDRYATATAACAAAADRVTATLKSAVTANDLKPLTAGIGKINADLGALTLQVQGPLNTIQARLRDLDRLPIEPSGRASPAASPGTSGGDPENTAFLEALKSAQATPRQTAPLRAWLATHPIHPKTPEALFQLGLVFLDSGTPTAARHYFTRLITDHRTSPEAAEATALLGHIRPAARSPKKTTPTPASPSATPKPKAAAPSPAQPASCESSACTRPEASVAPTPGASPAATPTAPPTDATPPPSALQSPSTGAVQSGRGSFVAPPATDAASPRPSSAPVPSGRK